MRDKIWWQVFDILLTFVVAAVFVFSLIERDYELATIAILVLIFMRLGDIEDRPK